MVLFFDNTTSKPRPKSALSESRPAIVSFLAIASQLSSLGGSNNKPSKYGGAVGGTYSSLLLGRTTGAVVVPGLAMGGGLDL